MNEIANRYGNALFSLAKDKGVTLLYQEEVKTLIDLLNENEEYISILNSGFLTIPEKKEMISKAFSSFSEDVVNFLKVVVDHSRSNMLLDILYAFNSYVNKDRGVEEGIIYSTSHLDKTTIERINDSISKKEGKIVYLKNEIDKDLIGGVKVSVNDHVYDGSIRNKLNALKRNLLKQERKI